MLESVRAFPLKFEMDVVVAKYVEIYLILYLLRKPQQYRLGTSKPKKIQQAGHPQALVEDECKHCSYILIQAKETAIDLITFLVEEANKKLLLGVILEG